MRPSSPARHLKAIEAGQLLLPFLAEAETSTEEDQTETSVGRRRAPSPEKTSTPHDSNTKPRATTRKRQPGKRKLPVKANVPLQLKLLVGQEEAAQLLSISKRAVEYLVATRRLSTRRIANRVLIPIEDVRKFARSDHPERLARRSDDSQRVAS